MTIVKNRQEMSKKGLFFSLVSFFSLCYLLILIPMSLFFSLFIVLFVCEVVCVYFCKLSHYKDFDCAIYCVKSLVIDEKLYLFGA